MPHNTENITTYHEGDALEIRTTVRDHVGDTVDLTGANAEWLLKTDERDADADAELTKTVSAGGIKLTDADFGELTVVIDTDETTGIVDWNGTNDTSRTFHHRLRVTDSDGRRATVFHGEFVINR